MFNINDCLSEESERFNDDKSILLLRASRSIFQHPVDTLEDSPELLNIPKKDLLNRVRCEVRCEVLGL